MTDLIKVNDPEARIVAVVGFMSGEIKKELSDIIINDLKVMYPKQLFLAVQCDVSNCEFYSYCWFGLVSTLSR